ncbi:serine kinase [Candidatus Bipolaricaulota bacterium]|nr:serine kinase [Candidatus Bipolaricaulota bacterium]
MRLSDLCDVLELEHLTPILDLDREVNTALVGDLLSDVLATAKPGDVWVTVQRHQNVVAVARVTDLAAVILARDVRPTDDVIALAVEHGIVLLGSTAPAFDVCGRLYAILRGDAR